MARGCVQRALVAVLVVVVAHVAPCAMEVCMQLRFGSAVVEGNRKVGKLAGLEVDPSSRRAVRIIYSDTGGLSGAACTRSIRSLAPTSGSEVNLTSAADTPDPESPAVEFRPLTKGTTVTRAGHSLGRLAGVEIDQQSGEIQSVLTRRGWSPWSTKVAAADLDLFNDRLAH